MNSSFIVITDLDSSLLDEDYGYDGAKRAIQMLRDRGFPLILNSSKTYAELRSLASEIEGCHAVVAENGGLIAVHESSELIDGEVDEYGYIAHSSGKNRAEIIAEIHQQREEKGYDFAGYADWQVSDVISHTGLTEEGATLSMMRDATEPIIWSDSEERWEEFSAFLKSKDLQALRGGRFIHIMSMVDKVQGMESVVRMYQSKYPEKKWTSIALGDSANDRAMLQASDIPVIIPHHDGPRVELQRDDAILAPDTGSTGWGAVIEGILNEN